ncbi:Sigma factor SigB regulation protein RsbQ [Pseudovibrio axinellae]|uniref:Sigma factor SigB regulation protein RsbQ n=1 Tax=Pseudovibrio axinellae TaxID=989403 RepID=A0A165XRB0_9HYPH|nr:alpha/beta hydrolase [Pseudovibrio axinellae]KZL17965.1 Sigma factor SigB regulation protein RsbQ [Pseudovibrio axinellae]SER15088.1 proline iminopeptidase [Pseudovibrio axinellae]
MSFSPKNIFLSFIILGGLMFVGAAGFVWWMQQQPFYTPGTLAQRTDLEPIGKTDGYWQVTKDVQLKTFATGKGRNILFIHGGPGMPLQQSAPAFDLLQNDYRINYYDQRGSGGSTHPFIRFPVERDKWSNAQQLESKLGIAQQLADIERVRRLLGDDKLILVGHSNGALLAALYAAEFPDNVDKLVLLTPADILVAPSKNPDLYAVIRENLPKREQKAYDKWLRRYTDTEQIFKDDEATLQTVDAGLIPYVEKAFGKDVFKNQSVLPTDQFGSWQTRAQSFSLGTTHDWRAALANVTADTLIIHGGNDFDPLTVSKQYANAIPKAKVEQIDSAGHFPHINNAQELSSKMRTFLKN